MNETLSSIDRHQILQNVTERFWGKAGLGVTAAFITHAVFAVVFYLVGSMSLAVFNVGSVVAYAICPRLLKTKRFRLVSLILAWEIILHSLLATLIMGWSSGFYYYLFCIIPLALYNYTISISWRAAFCVGTLIVLAAGKLMAPQLVNQVGLNADQLELFAFANLIIAAVILIYIAALTAFSSLAMQSDLFNLANTDGLTKLYNRGRLHTEAQRLYASQRYKPLALIMLDVDHFKTINDTYGHDVGDAVLQKVSTVLIESVRSTDVASRWGGEEFLILLRNADLGIVRNIAERIRQRIEAAEYEGENGPIKVTATLAFCEIGQNEALQDAIQRTDKALYVGKKSGRNRAVAAEAQKMIEAS
ncbi:diguanylate cyclase (GGDEF)-like protein [Pseudomonas duriflava]|uniref:diguanylate cyclase n=1 Tax=Pseudomonas duriflava TaxID=459528 RepID=A0A562QDZ2_9PSED|nr:GGDEF domain-containing protein [Pseudomonas duriflava]TWI54972.1 diguanylate cyclase (GGDEF)-like protein [Pseudomonas duriflava]